MTITVNVFYVNKSWRTSIQELKCLIFFTSFFVNPLIFNLQK
nr:MAG TPA: hypothetical protein [Caudoviricetes sp.]